MLRKNSYIADGLPRYRVSPFVDRLASKLGRRHRLITKWIRQNTGYVRVDQFFCHPKPIPNYRLLDMYHAAERYAGRIDANTMDCGSSDTLQELLTSTYSHIDRKISKSAQQAHDAGHQCEKFVASDRFWASPGSSSNPPLIIRVRTVQNEGAIEIGSPDTVHAQEVLESILEDSINNSIYRGQLLHVEVDQHLQERWGDEWTQGLVCLKFMHDSRLTDEDIIVDPAVRTVLRRNVFDFYQRRELLKKAGVPNKKALLFYGPPGTGKTYTCKYIYNKLQNVTCLVVNGRSLAHIRKVCTIARLYQPALVVLEDVDLVFTKREINLYSSVLGDMLDELDGFQPDEDVTFLLTTNAIERVEQAIKDRPGRINQCVYLGPPCEDLRRRYLERYLRNYDRAKLDLGAVVQMTEGTTQAYLKELVFRAVQISLEGPETNMVDATPARIRLTAEHFQEAHQEMTSTKNESAGAIVGFAVE